MAETLACRTTFCRSESYSERLSPSTRHRVLGAGMDYYREVMTDDPFRRRERENRGESADEDDKGDLFGLRQRPRHLRVLIDRESLPEPSTPEERATEDMLHALLTKHESVLPLFVDMSRINDPDDEDDRTPNVVHLRDYSDQQGWASLPGPAYGYRIVYEGRRRTQEMHGNLHPGHSCGRTCLGSQGKAAPNSRNCPRRTYRGMCS